jgi:hypothetical protein
MVEHGTRIDMRLQTTYFPALYNSGLGTVRPCYWSGDDTQSEAKSERRKAKSWRD